MQDIEHRVPLAQYSTLHVGGKADALARVTSLTGLRESLSWADDRGLPWFLLGGGANFFCRDEGFPGLVIKMENRVIDVGHGEVTAEAGALTRLVALKAVDQGLRGMERLAGIPGTIGGAVRGNAGAFGMETKDHLTRIRVLGRTTAGWEEKTLPRDQLFFAYRDSIIKREPKDYVVWSATFTLEPGDKVAGGWLVAQDFAERKAKQPYEYPSVGSIFKNPSPSQPAGKLIESAGLKGVRIGGAEISLKHANFIVNRGGATARDVLALIQRVKQSVFDTHGITLAEEIVIL